MLKSLWYGLVQIGSGFSSIAQGWAGTSHFDDYKAYMPGRPIPPLTPEEAIQADREALRQDWKHIGQYWPDLARSGKKIKRRDPCIYSRAFKHSK